MAIKYRQELKSWHLSDAERRAMFLKSPREKQSASAKFISKIFNGYFKINFYLMELFDR